MKAGYQPLQSGGVELGFGTTVFDRLMSKRQALRLLDVAYESGIRHFDTARMYDHGRTESLLGAMARGKRAGMRIVSKAGIEPPGLVGRMLRRAVPFIQATSRLGEARFGRFSPSAVSISVNKSLRALGTDYLDALLLHEVTPTQMTDELAALLLEMKRRGLVRQAGLATSASHALAIMSEYGGLFEIVQIPAADLIGRELQTFHPVRIILHSVLGPHLSNMFDQVDEDFASRHGLVTTSPCIEAARRRLAELLLRTAITRNPGGVVLFSSANVDHIRLNSSLRGADETVVRDVERLMRRATG